MLKFVIFLSLIYAPWTHAMSLMDRLNKAKAACSETISGKMDAAGEKLAAASAGAEKIAADFQSFQNSIDLSELSEGAAGSAAGLKSILWDQFSLMDQIKMAGRVIVFDPDTKGLRTGIFEPLTQLVNELAELKVQEPHLDIKTSKQRKVELYGQFTFLLFEIVLKSQKLLPHMTIELIPVGLGTFFPTMGTSSPDAVNELFTAVMKQFLKNAFRALTSRKVTLDERFAMLSYDMAMVEASGEFAVKSGIKDFLDALSNFRSVDSTEIPDLDQSESDIL